MLKAEIDRNLKAAMLSGDKPLVEILRSLKSAILYKEVAEGKRDEGLDDTAVISVLKKERKSRSDALDMYRTANEKERADKESYQIDVISTYLPESMSEGDTRKLVEQIAAELAIEAIEMKNMGQIMAEVKKRDLPVEGSIVSKVIKGMI